MKQSLFEQRHQAAWQRFDKRLAFLEKGRKLEGSSEDFAADYRRLCQQLALAQERGYSSHLIDQLQQLVMRGHQQFYRHRSHLGSRILGFLLAGLPRLVREEWRSIAVASLLFYGSALLMGLLVYHFPDLIYSVVSPDKVSEMESMYAPETTRLGPLGARDTSDDWEMFGFYVMNNIGIAFQTFASGVLLGLGSLFFLLFNGLMIGSVAGHLTQIGYVQTFWPFVIGHGAFELTAITFAGAAGLKLGWALLAPGRLTRGEALRLAARRSVQLIAGVIVLLLLAAFTEAYWSSISHFQPRVKYVVGAVLWLLVGAYFLLAGRNRHAPD
ncbi:stage II sporulation protein M [Pseudomonas paraeruginosa]|uniref:stage II sporulation protein M n=1 Tax=Pseudomonas aeruginosa group TaxID=136841 RepID=UPI00053ECB09|nr:MULTISPECIES: stage II sporulation protein M [Pseudomonas aeruginosa group]KAB0752428.1 stage II sporulation protein M [Pseudomonas aeruginosa]MBG4066391.1 stage II sporulation protein M [Pseudomonas aeruginosa]MBG5601551.1 stage II sporulation protein M [Pseudomonas aeruginosa]MBH3674445.1 stage II sporulation protein M [Pseudomonas aeruginosa]MBH9433396.1 stage II sporulation protein M [Pseudomonas aeruginosa]